MRQAGVLAAAAMFSLDNVLPQLAEEHDKTQQIAYGVSIYLLQFIFKKNQSQIVLSPFEQEKIAVTTCFYVFKPAVLLPWFRKNIKNWKQRHVVDK